MVANDIIVLKPSMIVADPNELNTLDLSVVPDSDYFFSVDWNNQGIEVPFYTQDLEGNATSFAFEKRVDLDVASDPAAVPSEDSKDSSSDHIDRWVASTDLYSVKWSSTGLMFRIVTLSSSSSSSPSHSANTIQYDAGTAISSEQTGVGSEFEFEVGSRVPVVRKGGNFRLGDIIKFTHNVNSSTYRFRITGVNQDSTAPVKRTSNSFNNNGGKFNTIKNTLVAITAYSSKSEVSQVPYGPLKNALLRDLDVLFQAQQRGHVLDEVKVATWMSSGGALYSGLFDADQQAQLLADAWYKGACDNLPVTTYDGNGKAVFSSSAAAPKLLLAAKTAIVLIVILQKKGVAVERRLRFNFYQP